MFWSVLFFYESFLKDKVFYMYTFSTWSYIICLVSCLFWYFVPQLEWQKVMRCVESSL